MMAQPIQVDPWLNSSKRSFDLVWSNWKAVNSGHYLMSSIYCKYVCAGLEHFQSWWFNNNNNTEFHGLVGGGWSKPLPGHSNSSWVRLRLSWTVSIRTYLSLPHIKSQKLNLMPEFFFYTGADYFVLTCSLIFLNFWFLRYW